MTEARDEVAWVAVSSSDHKHPPPRRHDCKEDGEEEEKADREGGEKEP